MEKGKRGITSRIDILKELAELDGVQDATALPAELAEEMDRKGLIPRWINAKKYETNYGHHKSGWKVYRRDMKKGDKIDPASGVDPDGYVRMRQSILAYMTKEEFAKHRRKLQLMNALQSDTPEMQADILEERINSSGAKMTAIRGYNENS